MKFIPTSFQELKKLKWHNLDVILVTGDTYIDSSFIGISVIGRVLASAGYKVGIIAQPDIYSDNDITRLGEPALFWGVTSGCMDSMVSNYTATKKKRNTDDLTPGGRNIKRPDRAVIVYTNLIKKYFKDTVPIVLGGIEASLRRISHYDYWSNSIKRSILFDSKADILVYGMGEKTILELAEVIKSKGDITKIRGICYISKEKINEYIELPSHDAVRSDKEKFIEMFNLFYKNSDPFNSFGLFQKQDSRYLVQNKPQFLLDTKFLDEIYEYPYARDVHPYYKQDGEVRAVSTIKFSITSHRGCYGECNFCSISLHQGRIINERSEESILREAEHISNLPDFKGYISDIGGPTANMYGIECEKKRKKGHCNEKRCLWPNICKNLAISNSGHARQIGLLKKLRSLPNIKKVFIGSGIRYDIIINDKKYGSKYLREVVFNHISGQLKIAPEHSEDEILKSMGKPFKHSLIEFKAMFDEINKEVDKKQFLTYYFIAAYPDCKLDDMYELRNFIKSELKIKPEQVQIFTPTPSTYSTLMYYTEINPFDNKRIYVEKNNKNKEKQKEAIIY
ncbi:MAG: YgiQ family radical SAM protein [Desulfobacterales bacterium]|nr:YgiQ family radical SAM protein [Desulfobacterales bacterium]